MINVYPAILSDDINQVQVQLNSVKASEEIRLVQIDVVDGYYADNMTVTPADLINLDFGELEIDFHLMVEEPLDYTREIIDHLQDLPVRAVLAQIERMTSQAEYFSQLESHNLLAGVSLDLPTPVSALETAHLSKIDIVQLMAIEAGFQGQKFDEHVFSKIKQIRSKLGLDCEIVVDGGIKLDQAAELAQLENVSIGVGSLIWESADANKIIKQLTQNG